MQLKKRKNGTQLVEVYEALRDFFSDSHAHHQVLKMDPNA